MSIIGALDGCAVQQDFIDLYGTEETLEITNLCDPLATEINTVKLQAMLDNATSIVYGKFLTAEDCGRALIKVSCKQLILWVARYIGDTTKARPFVDEDYNRAMEYLEYACKNCTDRCPLTSEEIEEILGEGTQTKTKLRCFSGFGNRIKSTIPLPKVDSAGSLYDPYSIDNYKERRRGCKDGDLDFPHY